MAANMVRETVGLLLTSVRFENDADPADDAVAAAAHDEVQPYSGAAPFLLRQIAVEFSHALIDIQTTLDAGASTSGSCERWTRWCAGAAGDGELRRAVAPVPADL